MFIRGNIIIIVAAISLLLAALVVIFNMLYIKLLKKNIKLEQQLLLSQLNPHFVFNSLTAIQSFIFTSNSHEAAKYLSSFAKLIRLVLENSRVDFIPITKEFETMRHYLDMQVLRFEGRFKYSLEADELLKAERYMIPPMLAQPFIENAIEHGFIHLSEVGILKINYRITGNDFLQIEVEDNGVGIELSKQKQLAMSKEYKSLATEIIKERLIKIRQYCGMRIQLNIIDLSKQQGERHGTLVEIKIPLKRCIQR